MNEQATHTPGPWEADVTYVRTKAADADGCGYLIAAVFNGDGTFNDGAQAMANARLIEQAPALLAALKDLLYEATPPNEGGALGAACAKARAAIAEAAEARP